MYQQVQVARAQQKAISAPVQATAAPVQQGLESNKPAKPQNGDFNDDLQDLVNDF
jgi:hypothetical protein